MPTYEIHILSLFIAVVLIYQSYKIVSFLLLPVAISIIAELIEFSILGKLQIGPGVVLDFFL